MKSGNYFQSNPGPPNASGSYYSHQSKTYNPYSSKPPSYEFGQKMSLLQPGTSSTKIIQNGIRLVGLAQSPKGSK